MLSLSPSLSLSLPLSPSLSLSLSPSPSLSSESHLPDPSAANRALVRAGGDVHRALQALLGPPEVPLAYTYSCTEWVACVKLVAPQTKHIRRPSLARPR
jgi:hypothetical protein